MELVLCAFNSLKHLYLWLLLLLDCITFFLLSVSGKMKGSCFDSLLTSATGGAAWCGKCKRYLFSLAAFFWFCWNAFVVQHISF